MPVKLCAISDLHGYLPNVPECDLLLIAGDICPDRNQLDWLDGKFRAWLEKVPAKQIIATWGNHDFVGQNAPAAVANLALPWHLLVDDAMLGPENLFVYGTPWTPEFGGWAWMRPEGELPWEKIPEGLDILVVHGPPQGYGDWVMFDHRRVGSPKLLHHIERVRPKLTVFGHIHEGYGYYEHEGLSLANVSVVDESYELVNAPFQMVLPDQEEDMCKCYICGQMKPQSEGGFQSTGSLNMPVYQWICNQCLLDKVCP